MEEISAATFQTVLQVSMVCKMAAMIFAMNSTCRLGIRPKIGCNYFRRELYLPLLLLLRRLLLLLVMILLRR